MRQDRALVLINRNQAADFRRLIQAQAREGWEDAIEIREIVQRKELRGANSTEPAKNADRVLREWHDGEFSLLIVQEHLAIEFDRLKRAEIKIRGPKSYASVFSEVNEELKHRKIHWLAHSDSQWRSSSIRSLHPDAWRNQFSVLGFPWVGEALLKMLRVVSDGDVRDAFLISPSELVGCKSIHAYITDDEPGSSWLKIKDILEHLYPAEIVTDIPGESIAATLIEKIKDVVDVVYLYEDGLWSGVELVKRLRSLCDMKDRLPSGLRIHFCYGATTDAGLCAGRMYLRRQKTGNVVLHSAREHHEFLKEGAATELLKFDHMDEEEVRVAIDKMIQPYAFRSLPLWQGRNDEAMSVCIEIGKQLVKPWLERRQSKNAAGTATVSEHRIGRWALGAFRFASTIIFSSSVPKPVLPVMWLDGQVSFQGKGLHWRPLFWDVRRTGKADIRIT